MSKDTRNKIFTYTISFNIDSLSKLCKGLPQKMFTTNHIEKFALFLATSGFKEKLRRLLEKEIFEFESHWLEEGVQCDKHIIKSIEEQTTSNS